MFGRVVFVLELQFFLSVANSMNAVDPTVIQWTQLITDDSLPSLIAHLLQQVI